MNYNGINGFIGLENIGLDTKMNLLTPLIRKLYGIYDRRHVARWPFCFGLVGYKLSSIICSVGAVMGAAS